MNDDSMLPEGDRDLELALRVGARLDAGSMMTAEDEAPADAAFLRSLLEFKHSVRDEVPSPELSRRSWSRIEEATRVARRDRHAIPTGSRRLRRWVWTSAAAGLVIGGLITFLVLRTPDPVLLAAAEAEMVQYTAEDGSVITLRPYSELYLVETTGSGSRFRLNGEGFFTVTWQDDRAFVVEGGDGVVTVLGTRFNLRTWGGYTSVYLDEGRVLFEHGSSGASAVLAPGQWSRTTDEESVQPPAVAAGAEHLDWLVGEIQFEQTPLGQIAAELEQHFNMTLSIPRDLMDTTLSGRILLTNARESLDDLGDVMGGRFVETGRDRYRFE